MAADALTLPVKRAIWIGVVLLALGASAVLARRWAWRQAGEPPPSAIARVLAGGGPPAGKRVLVVVGDSITQGSVSHRWADDVARQLGDGWFVVNAGTNGDLAWNVAQRLDQVMACKPDVVTVLVGTNDALAERDRELAERIRGEKNLPRLPGRGWYREQLALIARRLNTESRARVALLSLPTIGEDPAEPAWASARDHGALVREVAAAEGVAYLPLFERMEAALAALPRRATPPFEGWLSLMSSAIYRRFLAGQSWGHIGEQSGFYLHSDHVHLGEQGGAMVAGLVLGFVRSPGGGASGGPHQGGP